MLLMPMAILMLDSQEDQRFMAELYQAHLPRMLAVARRYLPEGTEAEDAVSDSVMALIRHIDTLRSLPANTLPAYIVSTVRNQALNHLRSRARRDARFLHTADGEPWQLPSDVNVEGQILLEEELRLVLRVMRALPEKEQLVLRLRLGQGMDDASIAALTGLSPASIRKYLSRARSRIRDAVYAKEDGSR